MLNTVNQVGKDLQTHIIRGSHFLGLSHTATIWLLTVSTALSILLFSFLTFFVLKHYFLRTIENLAKKHKLNWARLVFDHRVLSRLLHIIPSLIIYSTAPLMAMSHSVYSLSLSKVFSSVGISYLFITLFYSTCALLDVIENRYRHFKLNYFSAIKGYFQILKIMLLIVTAILVISQLLDKSPLYLLSSFGVAATLIFMSFKNTILGFVTSLQIASSDLIRVGDWIEVPQYQADGDVLEISLSSVKVRNYDNAIVTIPTYTLLNGGMKNWRTLSETGGRRILRGFNIDLNSITTCNATLLESLKQKNILSEKLYRHFIHKNDVTNVGIFRVYLQEFIDLHPGLHKNMRRLVRYLEPNISGLPIQIYAYTNTGILENYEAIQSGIFEHIFAMLPEFGLWAFQNPSGVTQHLSASTKKLESLAIHENI